jgi:ketosteroid isomerase-like protein
MAAVRAPEGAQDQLRWLVDRAEISELIHEFARALDERDWPAYADCYAVDGVLAVSPTIRHEGRAGLAEFVGGNLGRYVGTHHLTGNHAIRIDGDLARCRAYLLAAHLLDPDDPARHADGAGWYDFELVRTPDGWKVQRVQLTPRYTSGEPLTH